MRMLTLLCGILAGMFLSSLAAAQIAVDLSKHEIEITAGFDGTELLLFGYDTKGAEVVVIVRGPSEPVSVREKARTAGIWVNQDEMTFDRAPSFYFVATTDGLRSDGQLGTVLQDLGVGPRYLGLAPQSTGMSADRVEEFRTALISIRERQQLYAKEPGRIIMREDRLFRTNVPFPAATPVGNYTVTVYEVVNGWPVVGTETPLRVQKAGFGAFVYNTAHEHPGLYGIVAILIALVAGWFGGWAFRKS